MVLRRYPRPILVVREEDRDLVVRVLGRSIWRAIVRGRIEDWLVRRTVMGCRWRRRGEWVGVICILSWWSRGGVKWCCSIAVMIALKVFHQNMIHNCRECTRAPGPSSLWSSQLFSTKVANVYFSGCYGDFTSAKKRQAPGSLSPRSKGTPSIVACLFNRPDHERLNSMKVVDSSSKDSRRTPPLLLSGESEMRV